MAVEVGRFNLWWREGVELISTPGRYGRIISSGLHRNHYKPFRRSPLAETACTMSPGEENKPQRLIPRSSTSTQCRQVDLDMWNDKRNDQTYSISNATYIMTD